MALSDEDVREILRIVDETPLAELHIETDGFSLHVRSGGDADAEHAPTPRRRKPAAKAGKAPKATARSVGDEQLTITAPMLGTFYRAESPGKEAFVEVGSRVEADTIVAIVEVMKMMNSVTAGLAGTIVEVCAENAQLVEYGEPLFRLEAP